MAEAPHLLGVVPGKHVREVRNAEPHLGSECCRQQLARDFGRVDGRRRLEAIIAIPATFGRILAEVAQEDRAAASGVSTRAASAFRRSRSAGRRSGSTSCSIRCRARAKSCAAQNSQTRLARRRARAPGLLIIGLDALRDRRMGDSRTSGLSIPMPKATVAAMTISSELTNAAWLRARTCGSRPAW